MFFFIGGIGPRTIVIDEMPRFCPSCGRNACRHLRVDQYLSLFFIPIVRVKKGEPFWSCGECGTPSPDHPPADRVSICRTCGRRLDPDFEFCPKCGMRVD